MPDPTFDENYLRALQQHDAEAENFLITHFTRPVQLKLRARLRSAELAQDACQETFLRVLRYFQSGRTLDNPASLPGFIHTVCHNVALEFLRAHTRQSQIPENAPEAEDTGLTPEGRMVTEERRELVRRVLSEMPEKDRHLLRRVLLEEEDREQICKEFQVDRDYLRVLVHRARNRFRAVLLHGNRVKKVSWAEQETR